MNTPALAPQRRPRPTDEIIEELVTHVLMSSAWNKVDRESLARAIYDRVVDEWFVQNLDERDGKRQSAIIAAIDAYVARYPLEAPNFDLSASAGWHRNNLAFDIVDALRGIA